MAQLFSKAANHWFRMALAAIALLVLGFFLSLYIIDYSSYNTAVGYPVEQPLQFSHEHHVGGLGIDCRYCHQSFEQAASAGIPAFSICMNCHAHVWSDSPALAPVRDAYTNGSPFAWQRVNDLPDFTYFNHSIHAAKGIGCETCHGRVDQMPLLWKTENLKMEWCLDCHRDPLPYLRPPEAVTTMGWTIPAEEDPRAYRIRLAREQNVRALLDCYTCHR